MSIGKILNHLNNSLNFQSEMTAFEIRVYLGKLLMQRLTTQYMSSEIWNMGCHPEIAILVEGSSILDVFVSTWFLDRQGL